MATRQCGHFFFEPKGYDKINRSSHAHKEAIKVGYNLRRKLVLIGIWASTPIILLVFPSLFGWLSPHEDFAGFFHNLGIVWLATGIGGLLFRTTQLMVTRDVVTGLVWFSKILTDPFHDIRIYHMAPIYLLGGQRFDPMTHWHGRPRR